MNYCATSTSLFLEQHNHGYKHRLDLAGFSKPLVFCESIFHRGESKIQKNYLPRATLQSFIHSNSYLQSISIVRGLVSFLILKSHWEKWKTTPSWENSDHLSCFIVLCLTTTWGPPSSCIQRFEIVISKTYPNNNFSWTLIIYWV